MTSLTYIDLLFDKTYTFHHFINQGSEVIVRDRPAWFDLYCFFLMLRVCWIQKRRVQFSRRWKGCHFEFGNSRPFSQKNGHAFFILEAEKVIVMANAMVSVRTYPLKILPPSINGGQVEFQDDRLFSFRWLWQLL